MFSNRRPADERGNGEERIPGAGGPGEEMERRGGQREAEEGGVTVGGDCRPTEPLFQRARRPAKKLMK